MMRLLSFLFLLFFGTASFAMAAGASKEGAGEDKCLAAPLADAEKEKEAKKDCPQGPQFISVGPIQVPIFKDGKIFQYVSIVVALEMPDYKAAMELKKYLPQLNDAYLSRLYGAFTVGSGMTTEGQIDVEKLRLRLSAANIKVLPKGMVPRILLQHLSQRSN
jgi:flagellar basal body-associated protein FliL